MPNRLANARSLYLHKHADNPIDWWPWCDEALQNAKSANKPIFLSIGYSSCHWCTVMEGEAFSNEAIARYMNDKFVPIKVDREERPDIDSIYMQALQMMTGQGGWPLNIFLSPEDLVPFYGGTYFPVEPRYGRPGFLQILQSVRRFYDLEKTKLQAFKTEILEALQSGATVATSPSDPLSEEVLSRGIEVGTGAIGPATFGRPSFPTIPYANLALQGSRLNFPSRYDGRQLSYQRGEALALGGIFDPVGGGFHRYTVDSTWTVPHFEKMLYDNGLILEYLANLWSAGFREPAFERAIRLTVQWLAREMTSPSGYFYAAQDADSFLDRHSPEPEEGAFYVWRYSELEEILTPVELARLQARFSVTPEGNFEGSNVLQCLQTGELSEELEAILDKLFARRYGAIASEIKIFPPARNNQEAKTGDWKGRIPPVTDTKAIVAWNSLAISGLARASAVFKEPAYLELATRAADFILEHQWQNGRFYRLNYNGRATVIAQSEDYALFIKALLDLQAACPARTKWLEKAIQLQLEFDEFHWSLEGGYYNNAADANNELLVRERGYIDNATPSANGVAISNLVRLAFASDRADYLDRSERALKAFGSILVDFPQSCPSLLVALDWYRNGTLARAAETLLNSIVPQYFPTCVYRAETDFPNNTIGLVCKGFSCLEPARTREQLIEQIRQR